jgi:hypothetical protein
MSAQKGFAYRREAKGIAAQHDFRPWREDLKLEDDFVVTRRASVERLVGGLASFRFTHLVGVPLCFSHRVGDRSAAAETAMRVTSGNRAR